jgi:hypothetical protein
MNLVKRDSTQSMHRNEHGTIARDFFARKARLGAARPPFLLPDRARSDCACLGQERVSARAGLGG